MAVMNEWRFLRDAYGSAEAIETLLEHADSDDRSVWKELWSRLCHQGTVYTASYESLPRLAELADSWHHSTFNQPLFLATCIIASTDGPRRPTDVRDEFADAVQVLRRVAERHLIGASDDTDFVYIVQALLATEGDSVWARNLDLLADGEVEFACRRCAEQVLISCETWRATSFDDASLESRGVDAADPGQLVSAEARAYSLAATSDRPEVARQLLHLFGVFECPRCGNRAATSSALV
jgi:predicted RNA-binding Zn-ribbon protein involved in translation (DUF1610 family)